MTIKKINLEVGGRIRWTKQRSGQREQSGVLQGPRIAVWLTSESVNGEA